MLLHCLLACLVPNEKSVAILVFVLLYGTFLFKSGKRHYFQSFVNIRHHSSDTSGWLFPQPVSFPHTHALILNISSIFEGNLLQTSEFSLFLVLFCLLLYTVNSTCLGFLELSTPSLQFEFTGLWLSFSSSYILETLSWQ
jgi:hypothetical protein